MRLIDDRGRLFGRWNVIDAAALGLALLLIPVAYGASILFRTPADQAAVSADEPFADVLAVLPPEMSTQRVRLTDASVVATPVPDRLQVPAIIRLRCVVTGDQCRVGDASVVKDALLPMALPLSAAEKFTRPVTYLIFRIDELRPFTAPPTFPKPSLPVQREPHAEIEEVKAEIEVMGEFVFLPRADVPRIRVGARFEQPWASSPGAQPVQSDTRAVVAEVIEAQPAEKGTLQLSMGPSAVLSTPVPETWQVPAVIRLNCLVTAELCRVGAANVAQGGTIALAIPMTAAERLTLPARNLLFKIRRLGPAGVPVPAGVATVAVTFLARPAVVGLLEPGHIDVSLPNLRDQQRASLVSVDSAPQQTTATTRLDTVEFQEPMVTFVATLRVPVGLMPTGWFYGTRPVKVGAPFPFEGRSYAMNGWILKVQVTPASPEPPR